jgi:poly(3-hydroxybutyrate) depolymerase
MMSFALGCGAADVVRAIAPMAGNTQASGCEDGDQPVAMLGFIGLQDTLLEGSRNARDVILERNGCTAESTLIESSWCDEAGGGAQPCSCVSYQGCEEGYPATWCEFTGPHTPAPNAGRVLWEFFSQF